MPREKIGDPTKGRYAQVSWRRRPGLDPDDQGTAPGYVQLSVHSPDVPAGEFTDLDEVGIDRLIKALHKAKNQAYGSKQTGTTFADLRNAGYSESEINRLWQEGFRPGGPVSSGEAVVLTPQPEVTVESDATAAARLDTDRYRDVRKGNR